MLSVTFLVHRLFTVVLHDHLWLAMLCFLSVKISPVDDLAAPYQCCHGRRNGQVYQVCPFLYLCVRCLLSCFGDIVRGPPPVYLLDDYTLYSLLTLL